MGVGWLREIVKSVEAAGFGNSVRGGGGGGGQPRSVTEQHLRYNWWGVFREASQSSRSLFQKSSMPSFSSEYASANNYDCIELLHLFLSFWAIFRGGIPTFRHCQSAS